KVLSEVKKFFRPEFLNRIDGIVVFHALSREHILQIVDLLLEDLHRHLKEKEINLEVTTAAKELLAERGFDPTFGARPLKRLIQDLLEDPLSEKLLEGKFHPGDTVVIDRVGDDLEIQPVVELAKS
ncbi:MAG: NDP-hexose 4-ketoreductase, partial [Dehalococcoidia bacterium]